MSKLASVLGRGALAVLAAGITGCGTREPPREISAAATASTAGTATAPAAPSPPGSANLLRGGLPVPPPLPPLPGDDDPAPASPAPVPGNLSLVERLAREAAARPAGAVRAEQLVAALAARGISVARTRQVLGATLNARYCAIAVTGSGVVASVCELDSPAAARAARKDSEQRFGRSIPDRRLVTNGKSLLTIAGLHLATEDEASAIAATFAALPAT